MSHAPDPDKLRAFVEGLAQRIICDDADDTFGFSLEEAMAIDADALHAAVTRARALVGIDPNFPVGTKVRMKVASCGGDADDAERSYPPGTLGEICLVEPGETAPRYHIAIGAGDATIVNVYCTDDAPGEAIDRVCERIGAAR